jgi:hypothetical protein
MQTAFPAISCPQPTAAGSFPLLLHPDLSTVPPKPPPFLTSPTIPRPLRSPLRLDLLYSPSHRQHVNISLLSPTSPRSLAKPSPIPRHLRDQPQPAFPRTTSDFSTAHPPPQCSLPYVIATLGTPSSLTSFRALRTISGHRYDPPH